LQKCRAKIQNFSKQQPTNPFLSFKVNRFDVFLRFKEVLKTSQNTLIINQNASNTAVS